jgi:hypothetical protein
MRRHPVKRKALLYVAVAGLAGVIVGIAPLGARPVHAGEPLAPEAK